MLIVNANINVPINLKEINKTNMIKSIKNNIDLSRINFNIYGDDIDWFTTDQDDLYVNQVPLQTGLIESRYGIIHFNSNGLDEGALMEEVD